MKKFYKENRVFVILMLITLGCLLIIGGMGLSYIIGSNTKDAYGNRLDGIKDVKIESKHITEMEEKITKMPNVQDVTVNIHGKIVNFNVDFDNKATLNEVKNVGIKSLDFFKEDYRNFYDIQFLFTKSKNDDSNEKYPVFGYVKAGKDTISWSANAK